MNTSLPIGPFDPHQPHVQFKFPEPPPLISLESRMHEVAARSIRNVVSEDSHEVKEASQEIKSESRINQTKRHQEADMTEWLNDVHSLCVEILKCQDPGQQINRPFLDDLKTVQNQVDAIHAKLAQDSESEALSGQKRAPALVSAVESKMAAITESLKAEDLDDDPDGLDHGRGLDRFSFVMRDKIFKDQIRNWNALYVEGEKFQPQVEDSLIQYVKLIKKFSDLERDPGASRDKEAILREANSALLPMHQMFETVILPAFKRKLEESQRKYSSAVAELARKSNLEARRGRDSAASLAKAFIRSQEALLDLRYQKHIIDSVVTYLSLAEEDGQRVARNGLLAQTLEALRPEETHFEEASDLLAQRLEALTPKERFVCKELLAEQLNKADPAIVQATHQVLTNITKTQRAFVDTVKSDLQAVQRSLDTHDFSHSIFDHFYDDLEQQVESWNSLAEHPLYPDGACLKKHAQDSLIRYVNLEKRLHDLETVEELLPHDESLLDKERQTLESVRNTFKQDVLPTLQEQIKASQREYKSAAKALNRKSGLVTRWRQDSAASLIENFSRFQHALADIRYQKTVIEIATAYIKPSSKRLDSYRQLKSLEWDANVSSSSIQTAQQVFLDRMRALVPNEKTAFKEQLRARLNHRDLAVMQETHALLQSIGEMLSEHVEEDPFFQEIVTLAQEEKDPSSPDVTSSELYQKVINLEHLVAVHLSHVEWEAQENELIGKLEEGPSPKKAKALGLFFLALQAGAGLQEMNRQGDLLDMARTPSERDAFDRANDALQASEGSPEDPSSVYEHYFRTFDPTFFSTLQSKVYDPESIRPTATAAPIEKTAANIKFNAYLIDALTNNDLPNTMRYIQGGGDFNLRGANGKTALELATALKDADSIVHLLELGATPGAKPLHIVEGLTPYLFDALRKEEFDKAIQLIKVGADPNGKDQKGETTLLHLALFSKDPHLVQILLDHGAKVNSCSDSDYGTTPLHSAIIRRQKAHALLLLKAGADPNIPKYGGNVPLDDAIYSNDPNFVQILLDHGAKIDGVGLSGLTPLDKATAFGKEAHALVLLKAGADPNVKNSEGTAPFRHAIFSRDPNFVQAFIDHGAEIDGVDAYDDMTALQRAVFYGGIAKNAAERGDPNSEAEEAQRLALERNALVLLNAGADFNIPFHRSKGKSLLDFARAANMSKVVDVLIEKGASSLTDELKSHLIDALMNHDLPNTMQLIRNGADPNLRDANGKTALELAAGLNDAASIVELLNLGATPGAKPLHIVEGLTPYLIAALRDGSPFLAIYKAIPLIEAGADPNGKDENGKTAIHYAVDFGVEGLDFLQTLINYGANIDITDKYGRTPLHKAAASGKEESALVLLKAGADPNIRDEEAYTALHSAVATSSNLVQALIDRGANINAADKYGKTPLLKAIKYRKEESALVLLKAGADPNIRDTYGDTALNRAVAKNSNLVQALIDHSANINAADEYGKTPLYKAINYGKEESALMLLNAGADFNISVGGKSLLEFAREENMSKVVDALVAKGAHS